MAVLPPSVSDEIEPGDNILLLCPALEADEYGSCVDLLAVDDPALTQVLWISFLQSPSERLAEWERHVDVQPERAVCINIEAFTRSAGQAVTDNDVQEPSSPPTVDHITSPKDLTTLDVRITTHLDAWSNTAEKYQSVVCFDSVSILLQYVSFQKARSFLSSTTEYLTESNAIGHYHMDPIVHDEDTVQTFSDLCDWIVEYRNGTWTLRTEY